MAVGKDTIFERFLSPLIRLAIDEQALKRLYEGIDWETAGDRHRQPDLVYPEYYSSQNFHGIEGGYLNPSAAVSYDPITQYVLPPHETVVRQGLIDGVRVKPRRIIDLGCGTGSTTLMLKQAFPEAEVVGLDLSPYMLVVAEMKSQKAGLNIEWLHGNAESVAFADGSFDLVAASLLFHETPPAVSRAILRESFRLLKVGGQVAILDGNQKTLRQTEWLTDIFEEPYIKSYATGSIDAWAGAAGFAAVQTQDYWWVHQVTQGVKPLPGEDLEPVRAAKVWNPIDLVPDLDGDLPGIPAYS
ncbi:MAG: class I SAM-dependent methyltransferase [Microcoleus sp. PH2017_07_MST_O_A]|jgi:ubiquinone/menaquinone biosynthesis C-methylase UbiE|uniref:class I SAM-dependent methyltransferase n=1 Tax=unclassified Microcoleus TaxID=2642155 RepID=UPI001DA83AA2|nr:MULTISPECIES: class I SAM-dependent methyltransferase [unclassified Microcoleus]MCC3417661.1 class I SAM-dependent methyltransferase [Microcoleus sp. PH2017_07_MST_O_A]MCC3453168.1 class I SAM-dependent methyltransferase [Microcoleus sp. PH2017_08_TRC_O_A]MCC3584187.1 class I SAM-dependent methyltransferase [Microcoleus sp. PH2017_30_WIL_O_A]